MTEGSILLIRTLSRGGTDVDGFPSELALVLSLLDSGRVGDGVHSNTAHRAALEKIVKRSQEIIAKIDDPPKESCNRHKDCEAADEAARAKDPMMNAEHCHDENCEDCFGC